MTTSHLPGASAGDPIVVLDDVRLTLASAAGPVAILRGISLTIAAGETVALLGPSGSGKSTLMMVAAGIERASAGRISLAGSDLGGLDEDRLAGLRRRHVGIVFQAFHLIPTMTALENVAIPLELAGRRDAFAEAATALGRVGLEHRVAHYPGQLSGGEQQRVAIARALINQPAIIFCDAPTGNLDSPTGKEIIGLLKELNDQNKQTFVIVTHDKEIARLSHRTIHMQDGRLI